MNFDKYDVIVFDVDGTLYFQNRLRLIMAGRLLRYYLLHPMRVKELFIIKEFRSLRDSMDESDAVTDATAKKLGVSSEKVKETVDTWIYKNPLDAVFKTRDVKLLSLIDELQKKGKKIVIWSDYFALDKLDVLGLKPDLIYTADDEKIGELKPSPKALNMMISDLYTDKEKVLMVGDRDIKDGEAARRAGVDYIILGKNKKSREAIYETH